MLTMLNARGAGGTWEIDVRRYSATSCIIYSVDQLPSPRLSYPIGLKRLASYPLVSTQRPIIWASTALPGPKQIGVERLVGCVSCCHHSSNTGRPQMTRPRDASNFQTIGRNSELLFLFNDGGCRIFWILDRMSVSLLKVFTSAEMSGILFSFPNSFFIFPCPSREVRYSEEDVKKRERGARTRETGQLSF